MNHTNTLQIALAVVGGLLLLGIVLYNVWNTRRHTPRRASRPDTATDFTEPVLTEETLADDPLERLLTKAHPIKYPPLDALIDAVAHISLDRPRTGDALLAVLPGSRRVGSKPFGVEGRNLRTLQWELPQPGQQYDALQAGVQLANRLGALNEIEFSEFVHKAQALADAVGSVADCPDMLAEVARARELDQFASQHDAQLRLSVRAPRATAWSPDFVYEKAHALGFVKQRPGRMALPPPPDSPEEHALITLHFEDLGQQSDKPEDAATHRIVLQLDVPQVSREAQPFAHLKSSALALAQSMEGLLTDEAGHQLSPEALDVIGRDLQVLYNALQAHDLGAGSSQARRLFS